MEIWDVYDKEGRNTGRTALRGSRLAPGDFHLVVHIWPVDESGRYLIQKRASHLELLPDIWAATGGSAIVGEDSLSAAIRETEEELGLSLKPDQLALLHRWVGSDSLADAWTVEVESSILGNLTLSEDVAAARWATGAEILSDKGDGLFYDYGDDYFSLLLG